MTDELNKAIQNFAETIGTAVHQAMEALPFISAAQHVWMGRDGAASDELKKLSNEQILYGVSATAQLNNLLGNEAARRIQEATDSQPESP